MHGSPHANVILIFILPAFLPFLAATHHFNAYFNTNKNVS